MLLNEKGGPKTLPLIKGDLAEARRKFGNNLRCGFNRDKNGIFCYTHRARSKSYESADKIPQKVYDFICSTG